MDWLALMKSASIISKSDEQFVHAPFLPSNVDVEYVNLWHPIHDPMPHTKFHPITAPFKAGEALRVEINPIAVEWRVMDVDPLGEIDWESIQCQQWNTPNTAYYNARPIRASVIMDAKKEDGVSIHSPHPFLSIDVPYRTVCDTEGDQHLLVATLDWRWYGRYDWELYDYRTSRQVPVTWEQTFSFHLWQPPYLVPFGARVRRIIWGPRQHTPVNADAEVKIPITYVYQD